MGKKLTVHFDSLEKFYTECEIVEDTGTKGHYDEICNEDDPGWKGLSLEEIQKAKYFYNKGLDKLESLTQEMQLGGSGKSYKWDENDGDELDYDRFLEGLPCLKKRVKKLGNKNGKFIRLHIGIGENWTVTAEDMLYKSYTAIKLADYLEQQGYRVEISAFAEVADLGRFKGEQLEYIITEIIIKKAEDPLILPQILTCISPWMFRYHIFKFWTAKFKCYSGLGCSVAAKHKETKEDIWITSGQCLDENSANQKIEQITKLFDKEHGDED